MRMPLADHYFKLLLFFKNTLRCKKVYTGDNNRRHNAGQQALLGLAKGAGAHVISTPGVTSFTGVEAKLLKHRGCQLDLGIQGLDDGPPIALDLVISDSGTGKPSASYKTGAKGEAKGKQKRKRYLDRFPGIPPEELCCPSYGRTGTKNKEALKLQKRIINAFAAAVPTVSRSLHASRVSQIISVAIQKSVAYNALDFRYTTLAKSYVPGLVPLAAAASVTTGDGDDDSSDDDDGDDSVAGE